MINLEKVSACPHLRRPAPGPYFHPLFLIFQIPPPPEEVIKIYSPSPNDVSRELMNSMLMVNMIVGKPLL